MIGGIIRGLMKIIAYILEIFAWLRIALSPTILGCILGLLIYNESPTKLGLVFALVVASIGAALGIVWATRVSIKKGALKFITRYPNEEDENHVEDKK
jgi:hypothetical protein